MMTIRDVAALGLDVLDETAPLHPAREENLTDDELEALVDEMYEFQADEHRLGVS